MENVKLKEALQTSKSCIPVEAQNMERQILGKNCRYNLKLNLQGYKKYTHIYPTKQHHAASPYQPQ